MPDLCSFSELPIDACAHCRAAEPAAPVPLDSRPFVARHDGVCAGCDFDIRTGTPVRFVRDRLHHLGCTHG